MQTQLLDIMSAINSVTAIEIVKLSFCHDHCKKFQCTC